MERNGLNLGCVLAILAVPVMRAGCSVDRQTWRRAAGHQQMARLGAAHVAADASRMLVLRPSCAHGPGLCTCTWTCTSTVGRQWSVVCAVCISVRACSETVQ